MDLRSRKIIIGITVVAMIASAVVFVQNLHQVQEETKPTTTNQASAPQLETAQPTTAEINTYTVAADHPRHLYVDSLQIKARVLPVATDQNNAI